MTAPLAILAMAAARLQTDGCADVPEAELRNLVALELGGSLDEPAPSEHALFVRCVGSQATIRALGGKRGRVLERNLDLESVPPSARPRAVALALVELAAAADWIRQPSTPPQPVVLRVEAPPAAAVPLPEHRSHLAAAASVRSFPGAYGFTGWGGGVAGSWDLLEGLAISADLLAERVSEPVSLGRVSGFLGSASVMALGWRGRGRLRLEAGAGVRFGLVYLQGRSADTDAALGQSGATSWGGPIVAARILVRPRPRYFLTLGGELGYSARSIRGTAGDERVIGVERTWTAFQLGGGHAW